MNIGFSENDIKNTKKLLELDPYLSISQQIIDQLKQEVTNEPLNSRLQVIVRNDLEKYFLAERARFIHKY